MLIVSLVDDFDDVLAFKTERSHSCFDGVIQGCSSFLCGIFVGVLRKFVLTAVRKLDIMTLVRVLYKSSLGSHRAISLCLFFRSLSSQIIGKNSAKSLRWLCCNYYIRTTSDSQGFSPKFFGFYVLPKDEGCFLCYLHSLEAIARIADYLDASVDFSEERTSRKLIGEMGKQELNLR